MYFVVSEEGKPIYMQRKPFSECFFVMALAEAYVATSDQKYIDSAEKLLDTILVWSQDMSVLGRESLPGQEDSSPLGVPMILLNVIDEVCGAAPNLREKYKSKEEWCIKEATAHMWYERKVVLENVSPDGKPMLDSPEGRMLNPGHAIEAGWFLW